MNRRTVIGIVSACVLGLAGYQTVRIEAQGMPADRMAVEKALTANEQKINEAFAKRDVATMKSFIADDAMSVDMMGAMSVTEFFKQLPTMDIKITEQSLSGFKFTWADANTVVSSYTWTGKGTYMGKPVVSPAYASTVWTKRGTKWIAVFHQESAAMPMTNMPAGMKH